MSIEAVFSDVPHVLLSAVVLEQAITQYIDHYRCHEIVGNVTPADAYFGRTPKILEEWKR
ncbi:hypothetical protein [Ruegeria arenilitoris]|uniref:hypothetical protein n=1 Tax=Ruegeria arenilitoris TaxID=1173585 RepID=UPI00147BB2C5|nr:hypothetical protein [Ruegeria arenilitoris]